MQFVELNETLEALLMSILEQYKENKNPRKTFEVSRKKLPEFIPYACRDLFEELKKAGYISEFDFYGADTALVTLTPYGEKYFENKLKRQREERERLKAMESTGSKTYNIQTLNADGSNIVFGDVSNSSLTIDNTIKQIEKMIDDKGGEDKEALYEILLETKEIVEEIKSKGEIPKRESFFNKMTEHFQKHGWFYGAAMQLLGQAVISFVGG